jgi:hypothetical protein
MPPPFVEADFYWTQGLGSGIRDSGQCRPFFELLDRATTMDARGISYGGEPNHWLIDRSYVDMSAVRVLRLAVQGPSAEAARAIEATLAVGRVSTHLMRMGMISSQDGLIYKSGTPAVKMVRFEA